MPTNPAGDPVVVIGAGPVGQTASLLLARWGVPVLLLDAKPARDPIGSKALVQQRDVIDIWCAAGVGEQVAAEGLTWRTGRTFFRDVELFTTQWVDRGASPLPAFVNISQTRTEQLLDARIEATPLIELRRGYEVVALSQDADGVDLTCATPDGVRVVRAGHVIACGGPRSDALREALGVTFPGESFTDPFLICDIRTDLGEWSHERRFWFDPQWNPGRQVLVHPCPDSVYRIDWQVTPGYDLEEEERTGALDRRIRMIVGPDAEYEIVWKSVYRFHARLVSRMRVGRVLLAGDLAHLVSPFGARGLNSGVQDAENAAWKIAFARNGWGEEDALLESYHDERLAAARENIAVSTATMDFLVPRDEDAAAHRLDILTRAVTDPSVRPVVDSGRLAEPFWYTESPLVTPDPTRPTPARPPRGEYPPTAPGVLVPDVPCTHPDAPHVTRLRQLLRDGLLVLTAGLGPAEVAGVRDALAGLAAPTTVVDADTLTPDGTVRDLLGLRGGELWLVRPDGHLAAVSATVADLQAAARRCVGLADQTGADALAGAEAEVEVREPARSGR